MSKSQTVKKKIQQVRNKGKEGKVAKKGNGRDINKDNLTDLERSILSFMAQHEEPVSVKEIAVHMFGEDVAPEGKGANSVRTIRNALRIPKAMDLITMSDGSGKYTVTDRYLKGGLKAAEITAESWRKAREAQRSEVRAG